MTDILGSPTVAAGQLVAFASSHQARPKVSDWVTLASTYLAEGAAEGVAGDLAFCQALHETGFFQFGGDVSPSQNNFAGLGATGGGAAGASFPDVTTGVRAQIQHLHRYATTAPLAQPSVDPRQGAPVAGSCPTWESLDGHWAVPGTGYGESIVALRDQAGAFMTETWCPFATIERGPYDDGAHGGPVQAHDGVVEHVTTNWVDPGPFFANPINQASSHAWIRANGQLVQYLPLEVASWAQSAGNYSYVSVETDGTVDAALTPEQVATFGAFYAWVEKQPQFGGFGFSLAEAPGQLGFGWHGMGGAAWGGHYGCPGDIRKAQRPAILAVAQGQPIGGDVPGLNDVVSALVPPSGSPDFGSAWQLLFSGAVDTHNGLRFYGSYLSLPPASRQGNRNFYDMTERPDGKAGYVLWGTDGTYYQFGPTGAAPMSEAPGAEPLTTIECEAVDQDGNSWRFHVEQPSSAAA